MTIYPIYVSEILVALNILLGLAHPLTLLRCLAQNITKLGKSNDVIHCINSFQTKEDSAVAHQPLLQ